MSWHRLTWVTVAMATMYKSRRGDCSLSSISKGSKVRASPWLHEWKDTVMKANLKESSHSPSWEHTVWEPGADTKSFPEEMSKLTKAHPEKKTKTNSKLAHFSFISNTCPPVLLKSTQLGSSVNWTIYVPRIDIIVKNYTNFKFHSLAHLDIKHPKTGWMYVGKHRETLVGDQIPVGNLLE